MTVDIVLMTLREGALQVALYQQENDPFKGVHGLLSGHVLADEDSDLDAAARRILRENGMLKNVYLEQLGTFSGAKRDPRGWSVSGAYLALLPQLRFEDVKLTRADPAPRKLAFDHSAILRAAVARVRRKSVYSSLPAFMMPDAFTIAELRDVYQTVLQIEKIDLAGFRKKILDLQAIVPLEGKMRTGTHRPAQLYKRASKTIALFDRTI